CVQTYTVKNGDTCAAIEAATGVSDAQLHALNPAINAGCTNLGLGQTLCLQAGTGGGTGGGSSGGCAQTYTVKSGDTCAAIEAATGVSDSQLHALNPAINSGCTNLGLGQTLCLQAGTGGGTGGGSSGGCAQTYTVKSGDTCAAIEAATGVSDSQLHALNPAINSGCTNLGLGQTLCLQAGSGGGSSGGCTQTYTVKSGDTCAAIEVATGVSDSQLHALNPAINTGCTNLGLGQTLCLN
ncbi:hypothetical protein C8R45DRAFT_860907, partial [Mycena sanguinolenta]